MAVLVFQPLFALSHIFPLFNALSHAGRLGDAGAFRYGFGVDVATDRELHGLMDLAIP